MNDRSGMPLGMAAALAAAASMGVRPMLIGAGEELRYHDDYDLLGLVIGGPEQRYRDRLGMAHRRSNRYEITHIDTPKPISKRKARRLRGKARA